MAAPAPLPAVLLITDGSCMGNPGPGGWAAILHSGGHDRVLTGSDPATTNGRALEQCMSAFRAVMGQVAACGDHAVAAHRVVARGALFD